jgi:cystathionine beta-lyase
MDRHGRDSIAVDPDTAPFTGFPAAKPGFTRIPMWVADMNFATAPSIQAAITERVKHPAFGYFMPRPEYYDAIIGWQSRRNGVTGLRQEDIAYENGVLGGVISALNVLCSRGDRVLLQSPTYIGFTEVLENNGYRIVLNPMKTDGQGVWRIDLADLEEKLKTQAIHAAVFCSPHNPTGRVWERDEIEQVMDLYRRYDVHVVSDEIWSDILLDGHRHIPTQSVSDDARLRTVALYAPSKTFNLAGLVGSYHIIYDRTLRDRVAKESSLSGYNTMNLLSMYALIGAFSPEGAEWTDELCSVLSKNAAFACDFIKKRLEGVHAARPQGTYMLFLDCSEWCAKHGTTIEELLRRGQEYGVLWQDGRPFHGPCHIRMNLALPLSLVEEAFDRLSRYVFVQ